MYAIYETVQKYITLQHKSLLSLIKCSTNPKLCYSNKNYEITLKDMQNSIHYDNKNEIERTTT